jgi:integrase
MTKPRNSTKPAKPYPGYPLWAHTCGQWCKKVKGHLRFYGVWADPEGALEEYKRDNGSAASDDSDGLLLRDVLRAYDDDKKALLETGKIKQRTYDDLLAVADVVADALGKSRPVTEITPLSLRALSHKLAIGKSGQPVSPVSHKRLLTYCRMIFRFANEVLDCNVKYLRALAPPEKRLLRERRTAAGAKMFKSEELQLMLVVSDPAMGAVIYLGLFAGYGPTDCRLLTTDKLKGEFIEFPRPKTGIQRRCWLPQDARDAVMAIANGTHVFNGRVWNRHVIARQFKKLCEDCGIYQKGRTEPYSLRRTLETVAKNADVNQSVIDRVMGHERPDMAEVYNQAVFDTQLRKLGEFIEAWLKGSKTL